MELLGRRNSRRITVGVAAVVGASASYVLALGRLRELPDFGEADAALGWAWRRFRKRSAGRGGEGIVYCSVDEIASGSAVAEVICLDYCHDICRATPRKLYYSALQC